MVSATTQTFTSARDLTLTTERANTEITSTTDTFGLTGNFLINANGPEGALNIEADTAAITTDNFYVTAENSIIGPFNAMTGDSVLVQSAKDIVLESGDMTLNGLETNLRASNNGPIVHWVGDDLTATITRDMLWRSQGMLGNIGGRYVLEDFYYDTITVFDEKHRINRNTNGIEVTNVNGDLSVTAQNILTITGTQGSVEFRAVDAIYYEVPPADGQIWFFGINDVDYTASNPGILQQTTFARSNNYCLGGAGCSTTINCPNYSNNPGICNTATLGTCNLDCTNLSTIINEIMEALIAYGLVECTGFGFCP